MPDLRELLDLHDRLVASCVGVVETDILEESAEVGRAARRRAGYLGETIVVALAGGTGSGKSSLLNALAGEEVSPPGARRPTTSEPVAWIPANPEPGVTRLLDDIGVTCRVAHDDHPWLAVIDLPDTDSVVTDHRQTVDRILPLVDAVVWVLDPEKYQDARLHRDHLRPLADHADRFIFALNQIDRVAPGDQGALRADLRRSLVADGIDEPEIVLSAGDPPSGLVVGVEEVVAAIRRLGSTESVVSRRIVDQLVASADRLVGPVGGPGGTGFTERWIEARNEVTAAVAEAVDAELANSAELVASRDAAQIGAWFGSRRFAASVTAAGASVPASAAEPIRRLVDETARGLDLATRTELAVTQNQLEDEVAAAALAIGATAVAELDAAPAWWWRVRMPSYAAVMAMLIGVAMTVDSWRSEGEVAVGVALAAAAGAVIGSIRAVARRSANTRVQAALSGRRDATSTLVSAELERRVGRPLRTTLRARSAPGAAHTELMLAVQSYEERQ
ncbi:MAG TPA: GTPase [Acidimicrobiia bacterium]|nr:GTPase [Acidimicrobiia bacterium]